MKNISTVNKYYDFGGGGGRGWISRSSCAVSQLHNTPQANMHEKNLELLQYTNPSSADG